MFPRVALGWVVSPVALGGFRGLGGAGLSLVKTYNSKCWWIEVFTNSKCCIKVYITEWCKNDPTPTWRKNPRPCGEWGQSCTFRVGENLHLLCARWCDVNFDPYSFVARTYAFRRVVDFLCMLSDVNVDNKSLMQHLRVQVHEENSMRCAFL